MKEKINIFQRLLERFKFREPVETTDQLYILSTMREVLVSVLKSVKDYGIFYGMALRIFFRARKMGIRITAAQSTFIVVIISTLALLAVASGIALAPQFFHRENIIIINPKEDKIPFKAQKSETMPALETSKQIKAVVPRYRIGIESFGNENIEKEKSLAITGRIRTRLAESLGKNNVIGITSGKRDKNINLLLTGSVGKLGDMIMISAKIIDIEKGKVIFATSENIKSEKEINGTCDRISRNIAEKIKQ